MKTILVVDDEVKIVKLLRDYLERAGFAVRAAGDGKSALSLARTEKPDLVVLDLGLPGVDGLDVTRELRKLSNVPIIMLTARSEESDKLIGLELGADDYITKPFSPKEVVARVRVVLRRIENSTIASPELIRAADLTLDVPRMRVMAQDREIDELRVLRARHRRAHQEHPPQDRTQLVRAALHPDGLRRGLQVQRPLNVEPIPFPLRPTAGLARQRPLAAPQGARLSPHHPRAPDLVAGKRTLATPAWTFAPQPVLPPVGLRVCSPGFVRFFALRFRAGLHRQPDRADTVYSRRCLLGDAARGLCADASRDSHRPDQFDAATGFQPAR